MSATFALINTIEMLQRSDNPEHQRWANELKFYRYLPDFTVTKPDGNEIFVDAKASVFVEQQAHEHYQRIEDQQGRQVYLAVVPPAGDEIVVARATTLELVGEWRGYSGGSGTPCKRIDLEKTKTQTVKVGE